MGNADRPVRSLINPQYDEMAEAVAWMVDQREDIASDFSVFHRNDAPELLPILRYVSLAQRLGAYAGVVQLREKNKPAPKPRMIQVAGRMVPVYDNASPEDVKRMSTQHLAQRHGVDASQVEHLSSDEILAEMRK